MKLGIIGLGKMGGNMVQRLLNDNHEVVAFDLNATAVKDAEANDATGAKSLENLSGKLEPPRIVWIMVPAGEAVDKTLEEIQPQLDEDDIIVDGGNSNYKDTLRRSEVLSDGVKKWGLQDWYTSMLE